jgi:hypothetical protein
MIPAPNAEELMGVIKLKADHDRYKKVLEEIVRRRIESGRNIADWGILDLSEKALRGDDPLPPAPAAAPADEVDPGITEVDVDGREVKEGVVLIGNASRQPDGKWVCLANCFGMLCRVEVKVRFRKTAGS